MSLFNNAPPPVAAQQASASGGLAGAAGYLGGLYDPSYHRAPDPFDIMVQSGDMRVIGYNQSDPEAARQTIARFEQRLAEMQQKLADFKAGYRDRRLHDYISAQHPDVAAEFDRVCDVKEAIKGSRP